METHPRELSVIRHGQSAGNVANDAALASGLHQLDLAERDMDVELSDLGMAQASALSKWFVAGGCPDIVFSSPYVRAYDTARIGLDGAGFDVPIVRDERLREREFGILDRLTKPGIVARHPEQAAARAFLGKMYHRPPGGESWVDVAARIRSFYRDLRLDHPGAKVVVVTHQAVILLFRYVLEALTEAQVMEIDAEHDIANAAVTTYRGGGDAHPELVAFNDSGHIPDDITTIRPDVPVAPR
ncbi:MAG TPA: histidine phosphatase family protein [Acidimicrobiales bacterium]|nr:histidine phosphatase family protein [Acidimicrobiales bacterium]